MGELKKQWDYLNEEQYRAAVSEVISFFQNEREEEIGEVAARQLLDMFLERVGGAVYNKGIEETKDYLEKKFADLLVDIDVSLRK